MNTLKENKPNVFLLPEVRKAFDRKAFLDHFAGVAEWLYRKYRL